MENKRPKYKLVEIEWFDAQSGFGNAEFVNDLIRECKPLHSFSVGYLLNQDEDAILLGFMLFGEEMVKHNQLIPKGMIKEIRELVFDKR